MDLTPTFACSCFPLPPRGMVVVTPCVPVAVLLCMEAQTGLSHAATPTASGSLFPIAQAARAIVECCQLHAVAGVDVLLLCYSERGSLVHWGLLR